MDIILHLGFVIYTIDISSYLFIVAMDELTAYVQDPLSWCILFTYDIVLVDKTCERVNVKFESWQEALEVKEFMLSKVNIEYM